MQVPSWLNSTWIGPQSCLTGGWREHSDSQNTALFPRGKKKKKGIFLRWAALKSKPPPPATAHCRYTAHHQPQHTELQIACYNYYISVYQINLSYWRKESVQKKKKKVQITERKSQRQELQLKNEGSIWARVSSAGNGLRRRGAHLPLLKHIPDNFFSEKLQACLALYFPSVLGFCLCYC